VTGVTAQRDRARREGPIPEISNERLSIVAEKVKLFSQAWCDQAMKITNEDESIRAALKDAPSFTNIMAFETIGTDSASCECQWVGGMIDSWTSPSESPEEKVWIRFEATPENWRAATEGPLTGMQMLIGKRINLIGPMSQAIANVKAFNNLVRAWAAIPTDWEL
jgi:hypothetical protein